LSGDEDGGTVESMEDREELFVCAACGAHVPVRHKDDEPVAELYCLKPEGPPDPSAHKALVGVAY
jgi:hypothetical protein